MKKYGGKKKQPTQKNMQLGPLQVGPSQQTQGSTPQTELEKRLYCF